MEANHIAYDHVASDERINEILDSAAAFEELDSVPTRSRLTYANGYYVNCTAVFIDIRGSSKLPENHTRPVLGKIYRSYISECIAVMNGNASCAEVFINGDCVSGIFNTPYKSDLDDAFVTAAKLNSLIQILNWRLERKGYQQISCGIGMDYGRALMLKAGYNGSGINDVIWMGDVVNRASNLCHMGNKGFRSALQVSTIARDNLNEHNQKLLSPVIDLLYPTHFEGNVINTAMMDWLKEQKEVVNKSDSLAAWLMSPSWVPNNRR